MRRLAAVGTVLLLAGCVSSGNPSVADPTLIDQIKIDLSTKEDVKRILGQPTSMARHSGNYAPIPGLSPQAIITNIEVWSYTHIDVEVNGATFIPIVGSFAGGASSNVNSLTVSFDKNGIVRSVTSSQSQGRSGMGANR